MIERLSLAFRLAARELRGSLREFWLFLACLALGVASIAGVGSISDAMRAGIEKDSRRLLGGDIEIELDHRAIPPEARAVLDAAGRVSAVTDFRAMVRPAGSGQRSLVELKAVDEAYPLFGDVVLSPSVPIHQALAVRDGVPGVLVDPALVQRLELSLGDVLQIGETGFEVRAEIIQEPDRTVRFATFGPRVMIAESALADTGLVRVGSMVDFRYRVDLPDTTDVAAWSEALDAQFPLAGWSIRDLGNAAPGFNRFIDRVAQFLTLVGLTALLVGGVGIANAVRSFLDRRTGTIAILKCLGAPGGLIFFTYLVQVLFLATAGILAGIVVGAVAPVIAGRLLSSLLPVALPLGLYWQPLLIAALFGYATTLSFAIWPLGRARDVRPGQLFRALVAPPRGWPRPGYLVATAISGLILSAMAFVVTADPFLAGWFLAGAFAVFLVFGGGTGLLLQSARKLPRPQHPGLRLAIANLHRPGSPTAGIVLSLGLGLTVMVTIALLQTSLSRQIDEQMPSEAPSYFFIDILPDQAADFNALVTGMDAVSRVEQTPMVSGRVTRVAGVPVDQVDPDPDVAWAIKGDRGLTYAASPPEGIKLVAGNWWPEDYSGPPLISFDAEIATGLGIGIGDTITVNILGREVTGTIANLRHIDWATLGMNFVFVFAPGTLEFAPHSVISTVYAEGVENEEAVQRAVSGAFPNISAIRVKDALENAARILGAVSVAVRSTGSVTLLAGILVLASTLVTGQHRRIYDAVVLKVLGADRRRILSAYLMEFAILGILVAVVATIAGTIISYFIGTEIMRTDFVFSAPAIALTLLVSLVCTIGLGLLGTWRALSLKAAPLLRNE